MTKLPTTRRLLAKIPNVPCLYRHKINGKYYGINKINGKEKDHSLDTSDRKEAELQFEGLDQQLWNWTPKLTSRRSPPYPTAEDSDKNLASAGPPITFVA